MGVARTRPGPCWGKLFWSDQVGAALLNRRALGLNTLAFVHVSLIEHSEQAIKVFDDFVAKEDQIIECCSITGADVQPHSGQDSGPLSQLMTIGPVWATSWRSAKRLFSRVSNAVAL